MAKNNKTRFFYVLYSDKTWVFDQSERAYGPIYIIISRIKTTTKTYKHIEKTIEKQNKKIKDNNEREK